MVREVAVNGLHATKISLTIHGLTVVNEEGEWNIGLPTPSGYKQAGLSRGIGQTFLDLNTVVDEFYPEFHNYCMSNRTALKLFAGNYLTIDDIAKVVPSLIFTRVPHGALSHQSVFLLPFSFVGRRIELIIFKEDFFGQDGIFPMDNNFQPIPATN